METLSLEVLLHDYLMGREELFDEICNSITSHRGSSLDYIRGMGVCDFSRREIEDIISIQNEKLIKKRISNLLTRKDALAIVNIITH